MMDKPFISVTEAYGSIWILNLNIRLDISALVTHFLMVHETPKDKNSPSLQHINSPGHFLTSVMTV